MHLACPLCGSLLLSSSRNQLVLQQLAECVVVFEDDHFTSYHEGRKHMESMLGRRSKEATGFRIRLVCPKGDALGDYGTPQNSCATSKWFGHVTLGIRIQPNAVDFDWFFEDFEIKGWGGPMTRIEVKP